MNSRLFTRKEKWEGETWKGEHRNGGGGDTGREGEGDAERGKDREKGTRRRGDTGKKKQALRRFEWVVSSHFGSCGADAGCEARPEVRKNSPRRSRRTRRMEFDELSKRVTGNWAQDCWSRPTSIAFDSFVLFVSFVVK